MSVTLERCYSVNKYIYVNAVDCTDTYDECRDSATGDYGVYCDGTFYSRCYNGTDYSCVVGDECCDGSVDLCDVSHSSDIKLTYSGITNCGADDCAAAFNGNSFVCVHDGSANHQWEYESGGYYIWVLCDSGKISVQSNYDCSGTPLVCGMHCFFTSYLVQDAILPGSFDGLTCGHYPSSDGDEGSVYVEVV